jgi:hypothetical protein
VRRALAITESRWGQSWQKIKQNGLPEIKILDKKMAARHGGEIVQNEKLTSLDELLASQSRRRNLAVIDAIEGDDENVTVTWSTHAGCLCHLSIRVPKKAIAGITMAEETHECCGKPLNVVDVQFSEQDSVSFRNLFEQLASSAAARARRHGMSPRPAGLRGRRAQVFRRIPQMLPGDFEGYGGGGGGMGLEDGVECYADCLADCYVDVSLAFPPGPERSRRLRLCRQSCRASCFEPDYWA